MFCWWASILVLRCRFLFLSFGDRGFLSEKKVLRSSLLFLLFVCGWFLFATFAFCAFD